MDFGDATHIEDLEGFVKYYKLTCFYKYPFTDSVNNRKLLTHKDCICIALVRAQGKTSNLNLVGYKIEYLESLNFDTFNNKLDTNSFDCIGLGVIDNLSVNDADIVIKDLKANTYFYVKDKSELI